MLHSEYRVEKKFDFIPRLAWKANWEINLYFINVIFLFTTLPAVLSASRGIKATRIYQVTLLEKVYLWIIFVLFIVLVNRSISYIYPRKSSLFRVVAIGFCAGMTVGIADVKLQKAMGLTYTEAYSISSLLSYALTTALWLPVGSALSQGPKELRRRKRELLAQSEKIYRVQIRQSAVLSAIQERINQGLRGRLHSTAASLKDFSPKIDLFEKKDDLAIYLSREIAQWNLSAIKTMRELSHQIAQAEPIRHRTFRAKLTRNAERILLILDSFSTSLQLRPISPYLFTAMIGSIISYPVLREQEFTAGLLRLSIVIGVVFAITFTVYLIRKVVITQGWFVDIAGLILIMAMPWATPVFSTVGNAERTIGYKNMIFDLLVIFIFVLIHIAQSYEISGEELVKSMDLKNSKYLAQEKMTSEQIGILSREWAEHIHGRVVTRLTSASMLLEQVEQKSDSAAIISALDIIAGVLSDPEIGNTQHEIHETLEEELNFRVDPWKGILDINLNMHPQSKKVRTSRLAEIGLLVEEAISNSVRHGRSSQVEIEIPPPSTNELTIRIKDNSEIPIRTNLDDGHSKGMGLKIYDSVTDGNWTLKNDSSKRSTILSAQVALA